MVPVLRSLLSALLIGLALTTASLPARAEESLPDGAAMMVAPEGENFTSIPEDFEVIYDPKATDDAKLFPMSLESLRAQTYEMRTEAYRARLAEEVVIPVAPSKAENLERIAKLSPEEIETLVARKHSYLERMSKTMKFMRVPPKHINKILLAVNEAFYDNALIVARANANMTAIGFGVSGGAALSDLTMRILRMTPAGKNLPKHAGFWMAVGGGIAITHTYEKGWYRLRIEPAIEFRFAKQFFMPFASVGVGAFVAHGFETEGMSSIGGSHFLKTGPISITKSDTSVNVSTGVGLGLGWAIFPAMAGESHGYVLSREALSQIYSKMQEAYAHYRGRPRASLSCQAIFSAK